jgi:hypothetical protein
VDLRHQPASRRFLCSQRLRPNTLDIRGICRRTRYYLGFTGLVQKIELEHGPRKEEVDMPQRFDMPEGSGDDSGIDTTKRYDIYCSERNQRMVVYRNVLFKAKRSLFKTGQFDVLSEFFEIEQQNGQTAFISRSTVFKFCEHGVGLTGEIIE